MDDLEKQFETDKLHLAVQQGDLSKVKVLIESGENIDRFDELGWTPLHYALRSGSISMVRLLLENGANPNARDESKIGDTPLADVAGNCTVDVAKLLLQFGADPRIEGWMRLTALDRARERKKTEGVEVYNLLRSAADKLAKEDHNKVQDRTHKR